MDLSSINKVFFIGIGGIGMSALAKYFLQKNIQVYGYDREASVISENLTNLGSNIIYNFNDFNINEFKSDIDNTLVIYTPAISKEHPLLIKFKENEFNVFKRAEVLQKISENSKCIAVAGTHGKTTTSAILAHILKVSDLKFCAFVGGIMVNYNSNFLYNGEDYILVEADEFDRSFLKLNPNYACITSLDSDHLDIYEDSNSLIEAFEQFKNNIVEGGFLISHEDVKINSKKYGIIESSDYLAKNIINNKSFSQFDLYFNGGIFENLKIHLQGLHNVMNSVAAVSIAMELGISDKKILDALRSFKGIERRFSYKIDNETMVLIDDYAHHPEEIKQVYKTLKLIYPNDNLLVVFQPHLYSRTRDMLDEFAEELSKFDAVILLEIYAARENPIEGISSDVLLKRINSKYKFLSEKPELSSLIKDIGFKVNITLGAGDIANEVEQIKSQLEYAI
tara:strand:- start:397 stop:1749 length:1353 start_codon:yes stop_codon:yes gene_type:complete